MAFAVELDIYRGPLDLLLYLVRQDEVDVQEISLTAMAEQFLHFLETLPQTDVNLAGDFLEIASTLAEIKARHVLPRPEEEAPDEPSVETPRDELVRRLLEFKWFRDAAAMLEERSRAWQERHRRLAADAPRAGRNLAEEPLHEVHVWDLFSAFSRLMRDNLAVQPANIVYDETPIHVYMRQIHERLRERGRLAFSEMFQPGMHKSSLVSIFLASMELIRSKAAIAEQQQLFGEIWLLPAEAPAPLDFSAVDEYSGRGIKPK